MYCSSVGGGTSKYADVWQPYRHTCVLYSKKTTSMMRRTGFFCIRICSLQQQYGYRAESRPKQCSIETRTREMLKFCARRTVPGAVVRCVRHRWALVE